MQKTVEKPLRKYEAVIILNPDVPEADVKNFFKRNAQTIQSFEGSVNHIDTWGKRRLANMIGKFRLGQYFHTTFEAKGNCVAELERLMKIDDRVLRYVHVKLDDRTSLSKHVEEFHKIIQEANKREAEKEAKNQARKMAGGFGGPREGGPREGGRDGGRGGFARRGREEDGADIEEMEPTED